MNENNKDLAVELANRIDRVMAEFSRSFTDGKSPDVFLNALNAVTSMLIRNLFPYDDEAALRTAKNCADHLTRLVLKAPITPGRIVPDHRQSPFNPTIQ